MSRKPTLSPSRIATYVACPEKYYWTYINPVGRYYQRARAECTFGSTLHRVLQQFHQAGGAEAVQQEHLLEMFEAKWSDAGFAQPEQAQEHRELGRQLITTYYEQQAQMKGEARTIFTEKMFKKDMGQFVLTGRLDRVDEYPDGTIEIIDYKSGRSEVTYEQVHEDFAMGCYQLLMRDQFPGRPILASIIALRTSSKATAFLTPGELEAFEQIVRALGEEILSRDYADISPTYKPICHACEFLPLCLEYPDFELQELEEQ